MFIFVLPQTAFRKMVSTAHFKHDNKSEVNEESGIVHGTNICLDLKNSNLNGYTKIMIPSKLNRMFVLNT